MKKGIDYIAVGCWGVVTNKNEEILLIKRKTTGLWERPGGNVEVGETLEECIVREVREETGVKSEVIKFLYHEQQLCFGPAKQHWLEFCYYLNYISGNFKNNEPEKHEDVNWFKFNDLPKNLSYQTQLAIDRYLLIKDLK